MSLCLIPLDVPQHTIHWGCSVLLNCCSNKHMHMWKPIIQILKIIVNLCTPLFVCHWPERWGLVFVDENAAANRSYFCAESRKIHKACPFFFWDILYRHRKLFRSINSCSATGILSILTNKGEQPNGRSFDKVQRKADWNPMKKREETDVRTSPFFLLFTSRTRLSWQVENKQEHVPDSAWNCAISWDLQLPHCFEGSVKNMVLF